MIDNTEKIIRLINNGLIYFLDYGGQVSNLTVQLNKEYSSSDIYLESSISIRALKTSIVLLEYTMFEYFANMISRVVILADEGLNDTFNLQYKLSIHEIDYLLERETYFDKRDLKIKSRVGNYSTIEAKLVGYPLLLGKIFGHKFKLDKGGQEWECIKELKEVRDSIVHPKLDLIPYDRQLTGTNQVEDNIDYDLLFKGASSLYWYLFQINTKLIRVIFSNHQECMKPFLNMPITLFTTIVNLYEKCDPKLTRSFFQKYGNTISMKSDKRPDSYS